LKFACTAKQLWVVEAQTIAIILLLSFHSLVNYKNCSKFQAGWLYQQNSMYGKSNKGIERSVGIEKPVGI
jgi:hypothetical protein